MFNEKDLLTGLASYNQNLQAKKQKKEQTKESVQKLLVNEILGDIRANKQAALQKQQNDNRFDQNVLMAELNHRLSKDRLKYGNDLAIEKDKDITGNNIKEIKARSTARVDQILKTINTKVDAQALLDKKMREILSYDTKIAQAENRLDDEGVIIALQTEQAQLRKEAEAIKSKYKIKDPQGSKSSGIKWIKK